MTADEAEPRRPRGRPARTEAQVSDVRARIAACALRLFEAEGYEAISMRRLAQEAGCTPATIYNYFDSKFAILHALWAQVFAGLFETLAKVAVAEPDAQVRLRVVATAYVQFWIDHRDHYYLVFMSRGVSQAEVDAVVGDEGLIGRFDLLREGLEAALGPGASQEDLRVKSELLLCALHGIAQNLVTLSGYPWADPADLVNEAIDGLLRG